MSGSSAPAARPGKALFIVDSWAVLQFIYGCEPARTLFRERLDAAESGKIRLLISRINFGENIYNLLIKQRLGEAQELRFAISDLPLEVVPVDDLLVDEAAQPKGSYPISYADAFAAALARRYHAPVITGDPDFQKLYGRGVIALDWLGQ